MRDLNPLEPGVMFWAERDTLEEIHALGVRCGQMGIPGSMKLTDAAAKAWKSDLEVVTMFAAYEGEDYTDIPSVQRTVGFVPRATREARERRTYEVSDFAARLGIGSIACHIGFVPEDPGDPTYADLRGLVRRVCDHGARHGQTFALETGQEPAPALLQFIADAGRPNLRINFDPANMILYDKGDPVASLRELAPWVRQVHIKDATRTRAAGTWGREVPVGSGDVDWPAFFAVLRTLPPEIDLAIEREAGERRIEEIIQARRLIEAGA